MHGMGRYLYHAANIAAYASRTTVPQWDTMDSAQRLYAILSYFNCGHDATDKAERAVRRFNR